jgi:hypothetical protein
MSGSWYRHRPTPAVPLHGPQLGDASEDRVARPVITVDAGPQFIVLAVADSNADSNELNRARTTPNDDGRPPEVRGTDGRRRTDCTELVGETSQFVGSCQRRGRVVLRPTASQRTPSFRRSRKALVDRACRRCRRWPLASTPLVLPRVQAMPVTVPQQAGRRRGGMYDTHLTDPPALSNVWMSKSIREAFRIGTCQGR